VCSVVDITIEVVVTLGVFVVADRLVSATLVPSWLCYDLVVGISFLLRLSRHRPLVQTRCRHSSLFSNCYREVFVWSETTMSCLAFPSHYWDSVSDVTIRAVRVSVETGDGIRLVMNRTT